MDGFSEKSVRNPPSLLPSVISTSSLKKFDHCDGILCRIYTPFKPGKLQTLVIGCSYWMMPCLLEDTDYVKSIKLFFFIEAGFPINQPLSKTLFIVQQFSRFKGDIT